MQTYHWLCHKFDAVRLPVRRLDRHLLLKITDWDKGELLFAFLLMTPGCRIARAKGDEVLYGARYELLAWREGANVIVDVDTVAIYLENQDHDNQI